MTELQPIQKVLPPRESVAGQNLEEMAAELGRESPYPKPPARRTLADLLTPQRTLLAAALVFGVIRPLAKKGIAQDPQNLTMFASQLNNDSYWKTLEFGTHRPISWWLDRATVVRNLVIAATAQSVGAALGGPLGSAAEWGVSRGLRFATSPSAWKLLRAQSPNLANVSTLMSHHWADAYARALGEGLGDKSADGLLISLQTLQRENVADDLAWRIIGYSAGLPRGQALSVTRIALTRLATMARTRKAITPKDLGRDLARVALNNRVKHIMGTENQVAANFGTQLLFMNAMAQGYLPPDTKKVWVTAIDERVCPVCAPMDSVAVDVDAPFEVHGYTGILSRSTRIWVPPAHPNCRCRVVSDKAISHGIITRTARYAQRPQSVAEMQGRGRLRSRLEDLVFQAGPSWSESEESGT